MTKQEQKKAALELAKADGYDNVVSIGKLDNNRVFVAEHNEGGSYGMPAYIIVSDNGAQWAGFFGETFEKCMELL